MSSAKRLTLEVIRIDGGTQSREELNAELVEEYAAQMKGGAEFPPLLVFFDGVNYWLVDGFHRYLAYKQAGAKTISVEVVTGTQREAIKEACRPINDKHGLRRSPADKRKSVLTLLADEEWSKMSDGKIAEFVGVSQPFVSGLRREMAADPKSVAAKNAEEPKVGRDGKSRKPAPKKPAATKSTQNVLSCESGEESESKNRKISGGLTFDPKELADTPLSELKDGQGQPVPEHLAEVFRAGEDFEKAMRLCSDAKSIVSKLAEGPAGFHLSNGMGVTDLKNARTAIKFAKPFCPCPRKGLTDHSLCKQCKGTGFLTEAMFEAASKAKGGAA